MIGTRIASLRRQAGMSQAELAEKLNLSPSTIGMYEQGRREPPLATLVRIAELFNVSLDYLVAGKDSAMPPNIKKTLLSLDISRFSRDELIVLIAAMLLGDPYGTEDITDIFSRLCTPK